MAAPRARAVLLGLVLALSVGLSPAAASVTGLHGAHGLASDGLAGDHVLELLRETARAEVTRSLPGPPGRPAFTLWPAPPPENGHLFARAPEAPRLELVVLAPSIASDGAARLAETRIRAFGLFEPISRPGSNRVSRDNATGYVFGLWGNRVGPTQKGLWTDPVTGMSYARARWYDARNAHWLSEDPLGAVDSTNLYAFVGWQPNMGVDPYGYLTWGEAWEFTKSAAKVVGTGAAVVVVATAAGASSPFLVAGGALAAVGYAIHSATERVEAGQTDDAYEALKLGAGDATGVNAAFEGISGVELVTGREIEGEERARRLGTATGVAATFAVAPIAESAGVGLRQGASNGLGRLIFPEGFQNPYSVEALADGFSALSGEVSSTAGASAAGASTGTTSPWLKDPRVGIVTHLEHFREGASYLIPKSSYEYFVEGQQLIGDPQGQFVTTTAAMDRLLAEAGGNLTYVKQKLGIPKELWNEPLMRIDVKNPFRYNARLPSGLERGANAGFRWGGYTQGGLPEAVIDPFPRGAADVSEAGVRP